MATMTALPIETAEMRRLIAFASDVNQLANERSDLDLRALVDDLVADLISINTEEAPSKPPGCGSRAWRLGTSQAPRLFGSVSPVTVPLTGARHGG